MKTDWIEILFVSSNILKLKLIKNYSRFTIESIEN